MEVMVAVQSGTLLHALRVQLLVLINLLPKETRLTPISHPLELK